MGRKSFSSVPRRVGHPSVRRSSLSERPTPGQSSHPGETTEWPGWLDRRPKGDAPTPASRRLQDISTHHPVSWLQSQSESLPSLNSNPSFVSLVFFVVESEVPGPHRLLASQRFSGSVGSWPSALIDSSDRLPRPSPGTYHSNSPLPARLTIVSKPSEAPKLNGFGGDNARRLGGFPALPSFTFGYQCGVSDSIVDKSPTPY
jgi:hypothetical protein